MTTINWLQRARDTELRIRNFINGVYINHPGDKSITKYSPRDGSLLYEFAAGDAADVDQAVASAREAFEDSRWRGLSALQRKSVLHKLADLVDSHREELALYECLDVGKPITKALEDDISRVTSYLRYNADMADKLRSPSGPEGKDFFYQLRKPIGVVGGIIGWNYPLTLAAMKVGPALAMAMGNSLVLKPSEFSSLSASRLAELAIEAGVPPGVFNVVHGAGTIVGAALAHHPDVNLLTFTGSSATGKQMMIAAGKSNMKRVILECGGKSPYIVFDDCPNDLDSLAADIVEKAFPNQGALCVSSTRLLIQENPQRSSGKSLKEQLLPKIVALTKEIKPQDPLSSDTTFGALINEVHMNKVLGYIESGKEEGAQLICGGQRVNVETEGSVNGGYYISPAIFDKVDPNQKIAQEEIFGPVLSVFTFKDEDEAIRVANNSRFGLAAYAATENLGRAYRLAQKLNVGYLSTIGTSAIDDSDDEMAFDIEPHKESGFGPEGGLAGLAAYTVSSAVYLPL